MNRVIVTKTFIGICHMQVCAEADATDEEILEVCNSENPSGTSCGWSTVVRSVNPDGGLFDDPKMLPVQCHDHPSRTHFLVAC